MLWRCRFKLNWNRPANGAERGLRLLGLLCLLGVRLFMRGRRGNQFPIDEIADAYRQGNDAKYGGRPDVSIGLDLRDQAEGHDVADGTANKRSEEHTSELQSQSNLVCHL